MTDAQIDALLVRLHQYARSKDMGLGLPIVWGEEVRLFMRCMVRDALAAPAVALDAPAGPAYPAARVIEYAGYLADSAEALLKAIQHQAEIQAKFDDGEGVDPAIMDRSIESLGDHMRVNRDHIYEFRKRAEKFRATTAPAAQPQAEPAPAANQVGWIDEFGNVFPMGTWWSAAATWQPVYANPPAAQLPADIEALRKDAERYRECLRMGVIFEGTGERVTSASIDECMGLSGDTARAAQTAGGAA